MRPHTESIDELIDKCSEIVESQFGIKPSASSAFFYSGMGWADFCACNSLNNKSQGVYFPKTLSAHLLAETEYLPINFLHEFLGHGLFYEHSLYGKEIVSLEKQAQTIAQAALQREFLFNGKIDENNFLFKPYQKTKQYIERISNCNRDFSEGFAVWMEHNLAERVGLQKLFEKRIGEFGRHEPFELFLEFEQKNGTLATMYAAGFPKYYNANAIKGVLERIFEGQTDSTFLGMLYGSRKPYSDIDIFVVSETIPQSYSYWLDVFAMKKEDFFQKISLFDISVTDPIFSGEQIFGSKETLEHIKRSILTQPITQEAIDYNRKLSQDQGNYASSYPIESKGRHVGKRYEISYGVNANHLERGERILTLDRAIAQ